MITILADPETISPGRQRAAIGRIDHDFALENRGDRQSNQYRRRAARGSKQRRGQELDQDAAGARLASLAHKGPKSMKNPVPRR